MRTDGLYNSRRDGLNKRLPKWLKVEYTSEGGFGLYAVHASGFRVKLLYDEPFSVVNTTAIDLASAPGSWQSCIRVR